MHHENHWDKRRTRGHRTVLPGDFAVCNSIYGEAFTSKPARSCVEAAALSKGALVEIEVIAEVK